MAGTLSSLRLVFEFWRERKGWVVGLLSATILVTAVSLAFPYVLRLLIDGIKGGVTRSQLTHYVLFLTGFGILRAVGDVLLPFARGRVNERYQWVVRSAVFRRVLEMGHSFQNKYPTGDVMERLDHDMGELSWFACSGIFRFVAAALTAVFALVIMVRMNPFLTLVTVLPAGLAVIGWLRMGPRMYRWFLQWREKIAETNNQLQVAFTGIRLVKAYVMEEKLATRFRATLNDRVAVAVNEARVESRIFVFYLAIAEIATLLLLWVGGIQVVSKHLTLGQFVAFNAYIIILIQPMFDIGNLLVSGRRAQGAAQRIEALQHHPLEVTPPVLPVEPQPGELRLNEVTFGYAERPVLKVVSMTFPRGRKVGIAGTVGSGKSTIFKLLFRLADPQSGRVTLSGRDIRELGLDEYRGLFGYAPQEPMLFSDTVRNNILFGRAAALDRLSHVVELAQLATDIAGFPKGLDELLGERGTRLSGGQKARVAIARALVAGPPFLVLDDATSALDAETEKELIQRLVTEFRDRTVIIVSHRLSVLSACDYVYVLDRGAVAEEGTPAELLGRRGLYWQLYQRQLLSEELAKM